MCYCQVCVNKHFTLTLDSLNMKLDCYFLQNLKFFFLTTRFCLLNQDSWYRMVTHKDELNLTNSIKMYTFGFSNRGVAQSG